MDTHPTPAAPAFKWTIAAIRQVYEQKQHPCLYFDRKTMKFFGQTMKDFRVCQTAGRVFIYAPTKHNTTSLREFIPDTGALKVVSEADRALLFIDDALLEALYGKS